jgi:hypothetical protein
MTENKQLREFIQIRMFGMFVALSTECNSKQASPDVRRGLKMRYLKILGLLGIFFLVSAPYAHAQRWSVGVGIGGPAYGYGYAPEYVGPPPGCVYGYYDYYPYACAPYGYYGADWFVGNVFIGAGPWFRGGFYGRPGFRGGFVNGGRGFGSGGFRGGAVVGRGAVGGNFRGGSPAASFRGSSGGGFRGGSSAGAFRGGSSGGSIRGGGGSHAGGSSRGGGGHR